ncbi:integrase, partial [Methanococcoides cohabitans]
RVPSLGSDKKATTIGMISSNSLHSNEVYMIDYAATKKDFGKWLFNRIGEPTAKSYISYLDRYLIGIVIEDVDDLIKISSTVHKGWNPYAKSVRNLINYHLEKRLISNSGAIELKNHLKLKKTGTDTFVPSDEAVKSVLNECTNEQIKILMQLIYYSGIRITEAVKIVTEFDSKNLHFFDDVAYYDIDWERGTKKAFKAFMPSNFAKKLTKMNLDKDYARKYIGIKGLPLKYGRNFFIDKCVKVGIQESLIKYMIGHSDGSVLMTNYLEKLNNSIGAYRKVAPVIDGILA